MSFPGTGHYIIRPVDVPEGYNLSRGPPSFPPGEEGPVTVDRIREVWTVLGDEGKFILLAGLGKPGPGQPKWVNRNNVLFVTSSGSTDNFRIEAAGPGVWVIAIPNEDLLLTFNGVNTYPQLTFRPANGSDAQRFVFDHP